MHKKLTVALTMAFCAGFLPYEPGHASQVDPAKNIVVFKTPWCGCCEEWIKAVRKAGYRVKSTDLQDLTSVKRQSNVPEELEACHTASIGGDRKYILEGHVPLEAIDKLMRERPDIRGISTPGMPAGSLGMGYDKDARYTVYAFSATANTKPTVFYEAGKK